MYQARAGSIEQSLEYSSNLLVIGERVIVVIGYTMKRENKNRAVSP